MKQITVSNTAVNEAVVFTKDAPKYIVSKKITDYSATGGTVKFEGSGPGLESRSFFVGEKVTLIAKVSNSASFHYWIDENGEKVFPNETSIPLTYTFIMPARAVVITAAFGNPR